MSFVEWIRLARPSSIKTAIKISLYRLIGLNVWAERRLDVYLTRRAYRKAFGKEPDLDHPVLFNEKVTARKLYDRRPVFFTIADKLLVRGFVAGRIGDRFLPKIYFVCERFEEIDFGRLPDKFVIKANHGSHWVLIVEDKQAFDRRAAQKLVRRWMRTNYYVNSREYFYRNIERKILIEECLEEDSGAPVVDYKFWVYDGVPKFFSVTQRRFVGDDRTVTFFDRDCQKIPVQVDFPNNPHTLAKTLVQGYDKPSFVEAFKFPPNMEQLFDVAGKLGRGFDFLRVDLYNPGGRILVGELTSLPNGGVRPFDPPVYDEIFGRDWALALYDAGSQRVDRPTKPGTPIRRRLGGPSIRRPLR